MRRNRLATGLNVVGMGVGFAASILIFLWVEGELGYDKFTPGADKIFRLVGKVGPGAGAGTGQQEETGTAMVPTAFAAAIDGVDALLTPTTVTPAIPVASIDQNSTPAVFTRWVNFLDLCAAAVPNGFTAGGLPTSLQIVCRGYEEPLALRIGHAYQAAHDWHLRTPSMAG